MQNKITKSNIISSLFWKFLERGGTQGVQFIVQIILARLLSPDEYGIIAIVNVFVLLASVFVQSGLNTALIQKKDADELDFSSVFYLSFFVSTIIYILLFLLAPYIASYYRNPLLSNVLKVLSIILFFGALNSIQNAYIAKYMLFKKLFLSSAIAIVVSGFFGITAAYLGLGVWALVIQQIANQLFITIILWVTVKWRPKLLFSFNRVKVLFTFGWKLLASSLLNTIYTNVRTLLIGRMYSTNMIGFYNKGKQFPQLFVTNINGSIQSVMLPALSSNQTDLKTIKRMVRRSIVTSSFIVFPMMIGLLIIAEPLVILLLTEKWLPAVPFLQIYCLVYLVKPIYTANLQVLNALGRSDIFLRLEIITTLLGITILIISIPFGVLAIAIGSLISSIISLIFYTRPNIILINYGFLEQVNDILPSFLLSTVMGLIIYMISFIITNTLILLSSQLVFGVFLYLILAKILKVESYTYIVNIVKDLVKTKLPLSS